MCISVISNLFLFSRPTFSSPTVYVVQTGVIGITGHLVSFAIYTAQTLRIRRTLEMTLAIVVNTKRGGVDVRTAATVKLRTH